MLDHEWVPSQYKDLDRKSGYSQVILNNIERRNIAIVLILDTGTNACHLEVNGSEVVFGCLSKRPTLSAQYVGAN